MNATDLLRPPWLASARSSRWLALVLVVALALAEIPALVFLDGRARLVAAGGIWCGAIAAWWLLVAGNALWLARDATLLRLPRVQHLANASVVAYAFLMVAIPAAALALILGHALVWYLGFALAVTGCLLFLLLPAGIWIGIFIVFAVATNLHVIDFQPPRFDRLALYSIAPIVLLAAVAAWRWFRVLRMQAPEAVGLGKPVIWNLRTQASLGFFGPYGRNADAVLARSIRPWLAPVPDIHHTGPAHPIRTIRIALGRNVMPQTLASRARLLAYSLVIMAVFLSPTVIAIMHGRAHHVLQGMLASGDGGGGIAMIVAIVFPLIAVLIYGWRLALRWTSGDSDLALLTLLPRLGDLASVQRRTVLACLANALYLGAFELVLLYAGGLIVGAPVAGSVFALLCGASTVALAAAPLLCRLGGRPLNGWLVTVLAILTTTVSAVATSLAFRPEANISAEAFAYLAAALLLLLAVLCALCWQGWRALQRRPHPFLGTAP